MNQPQDPFSDADVVAKYAEGPRRMVPGFADLHRMASILLAERVPEAGRVLVVGAGGGLELKAFAEAHAGWTFDGVDPALEMLKLAERTLGPLASRARLRHGYVDAVPPGPFDAAVCLLTMHFVPLEERKSLLAEVRRRLRPGAPFVTAHLSMPKGASRARWLGRYAGYAVTSGVEPEKAQSAAAAVEARLHILSPEEEETLLREAGFPEVDLFYAGLAFRGWVAYAG